MNENIIRDIYNRPTVLPGNRQSAQTVREQVAVPTLLKLAIVRADRSVSTLPTLIVGVIGGTPLGIAIEEGSLTARHYEPRFTCAVHEEGYPLYLMLRDRSGLDRARVRMDTEKCCHFVMETEAAGGKFAVDFHSHRGEAHVAFEVSPKTILRAISASMSADLVRQAMQK